jgi:hypothetical protein
MATSTSVPSAPITQQRPTSSLASGGTSRITGRLHRAYVIVGGTRDERQDVELHLARGDRFLMWGSIERGDTLAVYFYSDHAVAQDVTFEEIVKTAGTTILPKDVYVSTFSPLNRFGVIHCISP